jgi:deoxyribodipyrimidine photo-lyase
VKTIIVWYRNDLRIHDHPALSEATDKADSIVPLFIFDKKLTQGKNQNSNKNRFLIESLEDLKQSLRKKGADLVIREGDYAAVLAGIAREVSADAVYCSADYTPYALKRDKAVKNQLGKNNVSLRLFPGRLIVESVEELRTKNGTVHKIFTPFYRNWLQIERRQLAILPQKLHLAPEIEPGDMPDTGNLIDKTDLSPNVQKGGEAEARQRLSQFLQNDIHHYHESHDMLAEDKTSRLSPYLHFGCISPLEIEYSVPLGEGPDAWRRQLAWRDFYHYVLYLFPHTKQLEFQEAYRTLSWESDQNRLSAWQNGKTGYPIIDASMRQLKAEGWMHNRARLIVGSFLTKNLHIDWREGDSFFMRMLVDGDSANNTGNWQWIASVGVDPAPVFRRVYNPVSQQKRYDPQGVFVRRYVSELADVPEKYLAEPWTMPEDIQRASNCIIGKDYPKPIIDHSLERKAALQRYREAKQQ